MVTICAKVNPYLTWYLFTRIEPYTFNPSETITKGISSLLPTPFTLDLVLWRYHLHQNHCFFYFGIGFQRGVFIRKCAQCCKKISDGSFTKCIWLQWMNWPPLRPNWPLRQILAQSINLRSRPKWAVLTIRFLKIWLSCTLRLESNITHGSLAVQGSKTHNIEHGYKVSQ